MDRKDGSSRDLLVSCDRSGCMSFVVESLSPDLENSLSVGSLDPRIPLFLDVVCTTASENSTC